MVDCRSVHRLSRDASASAHATWRAVDRVERVDDPLPAELHLDRVGRNAPELHNLAVRAVLPDERVAVHVEVDHRRAAQIDADAAGSGPVEELNGARVLTRRHAARRRAPVRVKGKGADAVCEDADARVGVTDSEGVACGDLQGRRAGVRQPSRLHKRGRERPILHLFREGSPTAS